MDLVTKLKKLLEDKQANAGMIMSLIGVAIGLLILAIVLVIGPMVAYNVDTSVVIPRNNSWNSTDGTGGGSPGMLNGSELWIQNTPLLGSAAIVVVAAIIITVLLGAFMLNRRGGG